MSKEEPQPRASPGEIPEVLKEMLGLKDEPAFMQEIRKLNRKIQNEPNH